MRRFIFIVFVLGLTYEVSVAQAQSFWKISGPERWWIIVHPFIACKAKKITSYTLKVTDEMKNDTLLDGNSTSGQVDAFRHAFWMACLSQKINPRKAISLGRAHEKGNYKSFRKGRSEDGVLPDSVSGAMDLFNNNIGSDLGCQNACVDVDSLKSLVRSAVLDGKMMIISTSRENMFLDCDGNIIDIALFYGKWVIPKCLIPSNRGVYK